MSSEQKPQRLNQRAHDPFFWLRQAVALDRAAMLIWNAIESDMIKISQLPASSALREDEVPNLYLGEVFWLNAGSALENVLKGIIVQDDPSSVSNGVIAKGVQTHNLLRLAKRASIVINVRDAFFS